MPPSSRFREGKRGKYYAGWDVYLKLASGNIRFFLQLVEEALKEHIRRRQSFTTPISAKAQTEAARNVGLKNFEELEGLDVRGARIMRLLLGVGRLFQIMAWYPFRHAPELNQFTLGRARRRRIARGAGRGDAGVAEGLCKPPCAPARARDEAESGVTRGGSITGYTRSTAPSSRSVTVGSGRRRSLWKSFTTWRPTRAVRSSRSSNVTDGQTCSSMRSRSRRKLDLFYPPPIVEP